MRLEAEQVKTPVTRAILIDTVDYTGKLRVACFNVIIPKATKNIEVCLAKLPVGKVRILGDLSLVEVHVKENMEYMCVGWYGYKIYLQGREPSNPEGLNKKKKATLFKIGTACPARTKTFSTQEGLYISAHLKGEFVRNDSITGYIIYIKD